MQYYSRTTKKIRRQQLLDAAITLAIKVGYENITQVAVAELAKVSSGYIQHYFNMTQLKKTVLKTAIKRGVIEVIAQGLSRKDSLALKAPKVLQKKALEFMTS